MKTATKKVCICLFLLNAIIASPCFGNNFTYELKKTIEAPYITERATLNKEFDFFICRGSKIRFGKSKNWHTLEFEKLEIKAVTMGSVYIGDQFFFHFKVKNKKSSKQIIFVINEAQNPKIEEYLTSTNSINVFGYKILFIDMNFSISKNSIKLKVIEA